jgi:hypothetical protein
LSRRRLLTAGSASLIAAPFWNLLSRPAHATTLGGTAKRLLVLFSPNGTVHQHWRPQGTEYDFEFAPGSILEPLERHKQDLLVLDELDFWGADNHEGGMAAMLTGRGRDQDESAGMSVDQFVAAHIGQDTAFRSLEFGVQTSAWGGTSETRMCYSAPGAFVTPDDDPYNAYTRIFGDPAGDEEELARLRARRLSVLDLASEELDELHRRLGSEERIKLEAHSEALRALERSLTTVNQCESPGVPSGLSTYDNDHYPQLVDAQLGLAVQALSCGITNVASVQLSHTVGPVVFSWEGISQEHHSLSHIDDGNASGVGEFVTTERWYMSRFAEVLDQLKALPDPEGGGTLLDSTLVLWASELGDGRAHTCTSVPWILAGPAGGAFSPGRYLKLGGDSHNNVLLSICHAMGLTNATFGHPDACHGPLGVLA